MKKGPKSMPKTRMDGLRCMPLPITVIVENSTTKTHLTLSFEFTPKTGKVDNARVLIELGANVNAKNNNKETPLNRAAVNGNQVIFCFEV